MLVCHGRVTKHHSGLRPRARRCLRAGGRQSLVLPRRPAAGAGDRGTRTGVDGRAADHVLDAGVPVLDAAQPANEAADVPQAPEQQ